MADKLVKFSAREKEDVYAWILYFSFASWLILGLIFVSGIYKSILLQSDKKFSESSSRELEIRHVLIDQKDANPLIKPDEKYFLSDKESEASGKLTPERGFENISRSRELRTGGENSIENDTSDDNGKQGNSEKSRVQFEFLKNEFYTKIVRIVKNFREAKTGENISFKDTSEKPSIPSNYEFKKEFAFSWDRNGKPVIPTVYVENFQYFKNMVDKIQENWAIPGGNWFPVFDPSWNSGTTTFQSIPDQEVDILFSLDFNGNVIETRLVKSMGYDSLDRACLEAIIRSENFGPPPKKLFENGRYLIMPFKFRLVSQPLP